RARLVGAGGVQQRLGDLLEGFLRTAGDALDELGGVAREVALDNLEDAARVLERVVPGRRRLEQRLHHRLERRAGRQPRLLRAGAGAGLAAGSRVPPRLVVSLAETGVERTRVELLLVLPRSGRCICD